MLGIFNGNIGSVSDITIPEAKGDRPAGKPFYVVSGSDANAGPNAPDSAKWVSIFVRGESAEKLQKLHDTMKNSIGSYFSAQGQASPRVNVYQGAVSANQTLSCTPASITLMGKPLGTGKPAGAETAPEGAPAPAAAPAAELEDEVVF